MQGPRPYDQARRTASGAVRVERLVRRRDHLRMPGQTEVVVRCEVDRAVRVEIARRSPLARGANLAGCGVGPFVPAHGFDASWSIASPSTRTIRWISSDVIVSGGIGVTLSPMERSSTPRSTAAALAHRPHFPPPPGR